MKTNPLFLNSFFIAAFSLLAACSEVKNTANKYRGAVKNDTLITVGNVADQNKNIKPQTIYFKASGTEPFWGLEITGENFKFTSVNEDVETFNAPYKEPIKAMEANVKMYNLVAEQGNMKLQMVRMPCIDAMSGKENNYQVTVEVRRSIDKEFKSFKGCGNYITDYRLHDIWMLEELNGQPVDVSRYGKERPRIEINAAQNSFMGVTGNHAINGKIFFEKGLLRFTGIVTMQNGNAAENDFVKNLQSAMGYTIENNRLLLFNSAGQLLQFKKTD